MPPASAQTASSAPIAFLDEIGEALAHGSRERRESMLRHVTDLFAGRAADYSEDEVALFDDVINLLAAEIEFHARVALATQLAPIPNAPPRIVKALAFDDAIEVAAPLLTKSARLDDAALVTVARTKSQQHLLAICGRETLSETVTDSLILRGDRRVLMRLADNAGARMSERGYGVFVGRAEGDDSLTERLGLRADIPRPIFLVLLAQASALVRERLEAARPDLRAEVSEAVAAAALSLQEESRDLSAEAAARSLVFSLHGTGELRDNYVEVFSRAGQFEETAFAISQLCDLPVPAVERALAQKRSETVLILAKAAGLRWPATLAILQMRAAKLGMPLGNLEQARASFDKLKPATAQELVRFYRARETASANKTPA
ncbi:MAG: DUF2336 domain-containing protein [Pseudorhodoplanes sp.]|nr:DUF2336 domain-containing protein [Pseudorhodoplanes sp.]